MSSGIIFFVLGLLPLAFIIAFSVLELRIVDYSIVSPCLW